MSCHSCWRRFWWCNCLKFISAPVSYPLPMLLYISLTKLNGLTSWTLKISLLWYVVSWFSIGLSKCCDCCMSPMSLGPYGIYHEWECENLPFPVLCFLVMGWAETWNSWVYPVMNWNPKPMSLKKLFAFSSCMFYNDEELPRTLGVSTPLCIHWRRQCWRPRRPLNEESVPYMSPASMDPASTYILSWRRGRSAPLNLTIHFLSVHCVSFSLTELSL